MVVNIVAGNIVITEQQVVNRHVGADRQPALFSCGQQGQRCATTDAGKMDLTTGQPCQGNIATDCSLFGCSGNTRKTKTQTGITFVHTASGQTRHLAMQHHWQFKIGGIFKCVAHHLRTHRWPTIAHQLAAGFFKGRHFTELCAAKLTSKRPLGNHPSQPQLLTAL